jgi:hypothetical protein
MKKLAILAALIAFPAAAQQPSAPPDFDKIALGNNLVACTGRETQSNAAAMKAQFDLSQAQTKIADLEKQIAALKPAAPTK